VVAPTLAVQAEDLRSPHAIHYDVIDFKADARWTGETESPYDFAVVRIAGVDALTPIIPLNEGSDELDHGSIVKSVGFGRTTLISAMGPDKNSLRRAIDKTIAGVSTTHLRYDMANKGICQGDSGGPVLTGSGTTERVVGIHSYVSNDCNGEGFSGRVSLAHDSFFMTELTKELPPDSCSLCEKIESSGNNECAMLTASCLADPNCKGYYECLSNKTKAACIKQFPLAEGPFYAAAKCICERSCKDSCGHDETCNVPKCGIAKVANERGNDRNSCSSCLESQCCGEEMDCAANGQCYVCVKTDDKEPTCAVNQPRRTLATCAANNCMTQCAGMSILNIMDPNAAESLPPSDPPVATGPAEMTSQCSLSAHSSESTTGSMFGAGLVLTAIALGTRRSRRSRKSA
jgi:hypothetical protein